MQRSKKSLILADTSVTGGDIWRLEINGNSKYFLVAARRLFIFEPVQTQGSCLINNYLVSNTRLYSISPFDSHFLIIPYLLNNSFNFRNSSDIRQESKLEFLPASHFEDLNKICDVQMSDNVKYFRINSELYSQWVKSKLEAVAFQADQSIPWVTNSSDRVSTSRKLAIGLICQFLPKNSVLAIDSHFTIDQVLNAGRLFVRRAESEPTNASLKKASKPFEKSNKKVISKSLEVPKLPRGQTTLNFGQVKKK